MHETHASGRLHVQRVELEAPLEDSGGGVSSSASTLIKTLDDFGLSRNDADAEVALEHHSDNIFPEAYPERAL